MQYIEDLYPTNIIRRSSLFDFLYLSNQRDEFIKSLSKMRNCEWVIHKKLGEAAGLTSRYIICGRGAGKSLFYHECIDDEDEASTQIDNGLDRRLGTSN